MSPVKHLFLPIACVLCMGLVRLSAQSDYSTAIGIRGGFGPNGLTIKHFLSGTDAVEGIVGLHYRGLVVTALYERHARAFEVDRLNWYYGGGGHVGFWSYYKNHPHFNDEFNGTKTVIGVDGILGIEYNIKEIPINISLDWKPAFNLVGWNGGLWDGGAFSVRYMIP